MEAAETAVEELSLGKRCTLVRGGCYGLCHLGPNVVVREDRPRPSDLFTRRTSSSWAGRTRCTTRR